MPRSKNENLMALAVMSFLDERPMHPYEIASLMRERGITYSIKLNTGNLYATIASLLSEGLIAVRETGRDGKSPERTVYELTPAGVTSCQALLREIIQKPVKEYPRFVAGLSFVSHLSPDEVSGLLSKRIAELRQREEAERTQTEVARARGIDELFLVEMSFSHCMLQAEIQWTEELQKALARGDLTVRTAKGVQWRAVVQSQSQRPATNA